MPSQQNTPRLCLTACLLLLCLATNAQPGHPNQGRRPERPVPIQGIGWLVAAGALVGGLALRRVARKHDAPPRGSRTRILIGVLCTAGCITHNAAAQERVTVSDGNWDAPSTWSDGTIPTPGNSTSVVIRHEVTVQAGSDVAMDNLVIEQGRLIVSSGGVLQILDGDSTDLQLLETGALDVWGTVIGHDGITLDGMSPANAVFHEHSVYEHRASGEGSIPLAQWHPQARFEITGISGNVSMRSEAWRQDWGTVVYDGAAQGEFVEFRGLLGTIQGDFIISSTRNSILRLAQSQALHLAVGGDLIISGPSEIWFSQSSAAVVEVGGDFVFASTSGASSYFTTTGFAEVTIGGDLVVNAVHRLRMASATGTGRTELTVRGDVTLSSGRLDAAGTGSGTVTFDGSEPQRVSIARSGSTGFEGHINFIIPNGADVDLGTSRLGNTLGGDLLVDGTLRLGSLNEAGAIQAGADGNIQVAGEIIFGPESRLIYNGDGTQYLSYPNLTTQVDILCPAAVVLADIRFGGLNTGASEFTAGAHIISVARNLRSDRAITLGTVVMNGSGEQVVDMSACTVHELIVNQAVAGTIVLAQPFSVSGTLSVQSPGSHVIANGNLTLSSTSEGPEGTASVSRLAAGSAVTGDVVVQRFIAGAHGDHYRYISTAVTDASVADLMDDMPVTGTFDDADQGGELPADAPSLFYYSEEARDWIPFPATGPSHENLFTSGRGYCVFNWNGQNDTHWDVVGTLHQGPISLPVTYTASEDTTMRGWNLVGNPYPSTIRWGPEGWDSENVSASIAVRDYQIGGFRYWDGEVGSLADGLVASGQSFWVRTMGDAPYLVITEDAKASVGGAYHRRHVPDFVTLSVSDGALTDHAYLRLREDASAALDGFDAPKMSNDSLSLAFRTTDGVPVAINAMPPLTCAVHVPLAIQGESGASLTFRIAAHGALQRASFALFDVGADKYLTFDATGEITIRGTTPLQLDFIVDNCIPLVLGTKYPERQDIVAFPIPAAETVFLTGRGIDAEETVHVYSANGQLVKVSKAIADGNDCISVNLTGLAPGPYYLFLPGKSFLSGIRVIKAH